MAGRMPDVGSSEIDVLVGVSTSTKNLDRRGAVRGSWLKYLSEDGSPLTKEQRQRIEVKFVVSDIKDAKVKAEADGFGDMVLLDVAEGYENLWRKVIGFCKWAVARKNFRFFMHADDDSFVRLDLIMDLVKSWPVQRFYWGYIWNLNADSPQTSPIRNPNNKSHMPSEQYPMDYYPPFASGCCFVLSRDLVEALASAELPDYRVMDPPFGIHLCGRDLCILKEPIHPVHDPRVRPYRPLPLFRADTLCQHYMFPEEMKGYHRSALQSAGSTQEPCSSGPVQNNMSEDPAANLYESLVDLGIFRR